MWRIKEMLKKIQFDRYWDRIKIILKGLGYQNMVKFHMTFR